MGFGQADPQRTDPKRKDVVMSLYQCYLVLHNILYIVLCLSYQMICVKCRRILILLQKQIYNGIGYLEADTKLSSFNHEVVDNKTMSGSCEMHGFEGKPITSF